MPGHHARRLNGAAGRHLGQLWASTTSRPGKKSTQSMKPTNRVMPVTFGRQNCTLISPTVTGVSPALRGKCLHFPGRTGGSSSSPSAPTPRVHQLPCPWIWAWLLMELTSSKVVNVSCESGTETVHPLRAAFSARLVCSLRAALQPLQPIPTGQIGKVLWNNGMHTRCGDCRSGPVRSCDSF